MRTFADKYANLFDKNYKLSNDYEFILKSLRLKELSQNFESLSRDEQFQLQDEQSQTQTRYKPANAKDKRQIELFSIKKDDDIEDELITTNSKELADSLGKLTQFGGKHSTFVSQKLRNAIYLDDEIDLSFRALRLLKASREFSGNLTCVVSSLDGFDSKSEKMLTFGKYKQNTNDTDDRCTP